MAIVLRCHSCRRFFAIKKDRCPSCGTTVTLKEREIYFRRDVKGQRSVKRFEGTSLRLAQEEYGQWVEGLENVGDKVRISSVFGEYLQHLRSAGRRITDSAELFYNRFVENFGDVFSDRIDALALKRFQRELLGRGLAQSTVDRHFAMYKAAWKYRFGDHGPFKQVRLFRPDNTVVRWLTAAEEAALLRSCQRSANAELYGIVVMAINTGLRSRNITGLRWDQIDFDSAIVTVTQKGSRRLTIPLNAQVMAVLRSRKRDSDFVFRNPLTMSAYDGVPRKVWDRAKREAGINRVFRFHDLRHHFATKVATVAGSLGVVRDLMGHSDLSISSKYLHVIDGAKRSAVEQLGNCGVEKEEMVG